MHPTQCFLQKPATVALVALLTWSTAYAQSVQKMIDEFVQGRLPEWVSLYKELHQHPELSLEESESAARIAARLRALEFTVVEKLGGNGVVGLLKNGDGPCVMIRGDMDALPVVEETGLPYASAVRVTREDGSTVGVMHACGHDVHQTCLLASAETLAKLRDQWQGTLMILAQPAEEIGAGARMMIEDDVFKKTVKPDYCLALHVSSAVPAGFVTYTPGWALANVDSVDITVFGRGGHGSRPNETVDPIVAASHVVVALQTIVSRRLEPTEPGVVTVGSFHAGSKHNIIPDEARLQLTVRSYGEETRKLLLDSIRQITRDTCKALGCEREPEIIIRDHEFTPSTYNDPDLSARAANIMERVVGNEKVTTTKPVMGGEDFGRYAATLEVPGFIFWLGSVPQERYDASLQENGAPLPSIHSSRYYPDPEPTIETGVRCMTAIALDLFHNK
ncbi:MAG: amidohydrolase [Phycisphaerae bacterium]